MTNANPSTTTAAPEVASVTHHPGLFPRKKTIVFLGLLFWSFHSNSQQRAFNGLSNKRIKTASMTDGGNESNENDTYSEENVLLFDPQKEMLQKRCPNGFNFNLSIPGKFPWVTINPDDIDGQSLGEGTLDMFQGHWEAIQEGENFSSYNYTNFCPVTSANGPWLCNTGNHPRTAKKYSANGLREFNASQFVNFFKDKGPLVFVGDSLMRQMHYSLNCLLESQLGKEGKNEVLFTHIFKSIETPMPEKLETVSLGFSHITMPISFRAIVDPKRNWVDEVISLNASYMVYNVGAWYMHIFRKRDDWCSWHAWEGLHYIDIVKIFEETFREPLLQSFNKLKSNGVIPIWRDTSPGGVWSKDGLPLHNGTFPHNRPDIHLSEYFKDYLLHPVFNQIGREITKKAGGLLLPIYDLSAQRLNDDLMLTGGGHDQLHWCCGHSPNAVPSVWIQLLQAILFDENGESHLELNTKGEKTPKGNESCSGDISDHASTHDWSESSDEAFIPKYTAWSESGKSSCPCTISKHLFHCVANIGCKWFPNPDNKPFGKDIIKPKWGICVPRNWTLADATKEYSRTE